MIEFFTQYEDPNDDWEHWVPVSITLYSGIDGIRYLTCAMVEEDKLIVTNETLQKDIAAFAESWARRIRQNGWIEQGYRVSG
jgi:hypothetical protein